MTGTPPDTATEVFVAVRPIAGAARVARLLVTGAVSRVAAGLEPGQINGHPALILRVEGEIDTVMTLRIDDGLITGLYAVRNPAKLSHVERETAVRR